MKSSVTISRVMTHVLVWLVVVLFWTLYAYFNTRNIRTSMANGFSDTMNYAIGYYFISLVLLPRLLRRRKVFFSVIYFIVLILFVGGLRIQGYRLIRFFFDQPFTMGFSNYVYVFTTTTTILAASASINLVIDWLQSERKMEQVKREHATTELNFLKGQLNPHFLFNSLNTLYGHIDMSNEAARNILLKLSEMLRYQLYECNVDRIELGKEISYLKNYVTLQKLRSNPGLRIDFSVLNEQAPSRIPPLLLSPFVENAFKHVSKSKADNWIIISLSGSRNLLNFSVSNSVDGQGEKALESVGGIGIVNIRRRLELLYPGRHELEIKEEPGTFTVRLQLHEA